MRPTISLASWRIATDLAATRALASLVPPPSCGRGCPWCRNWAAAHDAALPASVVAELRRLGINPAVPADIYAYAEPANGGGAIPHRVTFHAVGRILSGPGVWTEDPRFGRGRFYAPLDGPAGELQPGLSVAYERDVGGAAPWHVTAPTPLLQIDFRIPVSWRLAEPRPAVHAGAPSPGAV